MTSWEARPELQAWLGTAPRGLLSDIDGTLSPIRERPEEAEVDPTCRDLLGRLAGRVDLLGFLSGRPVEVARRMVGLEAVYVGGHGLERWSGEGVEPHPELAAWQGALRRARERLTREIPPGLHLEDKGWALALHYRERPHLGRQARELAERLSAQLGLVARTGRQVVELLPAVQADKGGALGQILARAGLRAALYLGDDRTDVDAFRVLREWPGVGVAVGVQSAESPPEVAALAHFTVEGVAGVRELLAWLDMRLAAG